MGRHSDRFPVTDYWPVSHSASGDRAALLSAAGVIERRVPRKTFTVRLVLRCLRRLAAQL